MRGARCNRATAPVSAPPFFRHPGEGVVSREIGDKFAGSFVFEASQSCVVVVMNESGDEVIALLMRSEAVLALVAAGFGRGLQGFGQTAVETLGHAVGLGPERPRENVPDAVSFAELVEVMFTRRLAFRFARLVDGVTVGELAAIVSEDGVNGDGEGLEKALEKAGARPSFAVGQDFEINKACGAINGDIGIGPAPVECGQIFDVDMDKAERLFGCEGQRLLRFAARRLRYAVALEAAMHRRARDVRPEAAAHDFRNIVDGQRQSGSQLNGDFLLDRVEARLNMLGPMRAVGGRGPRLPAAHGLLMHAELIGKLGCRSPARLNIGPRPRGRRCIGVQFGQHERISITRTIPNSTPIRSRQSPGTQHESRGPAFPACRRPKLDPGFRRDDGSRGAFCF